MNKGLFLLYSFAYGAVLEKMPGLKELTERTRQYLEGDSSLEDELEKSVPRLIIAWNHLRKEAKESGRDLLDPRSVKNYVFKKHNLLMPKHCAVGAAEIITLDKDKKKIEALDESNGRKIFIKSLPKMVAGLKPGDIIAYHYQWLVCKIDKSQRNSLVKNPGLKL